MSESRRSVAAVPNAAIVRGRIRRIAADPAGGTVWELAVETARDVPGMPNFAQAHVGQDLSVYVHPELSHDLAEGDRVQARVTFRGDERGGRFALAADDVRKV